MARDLKTRSTVPGGVSSSDSGRAYSDFTSLQGPVRGAAEHANEIWDPIDVPTPVLDGLEVVRESGETHMHSGGLCPPSNH